MSSQHKNRKSLVSTSHFTRRIADKSQNQQSLVWYKLKPLGKPTPNWNDSSSTWRHSSPKHSFPKSRRFASCQGSHLDIIQLETPTGLSKISCTFGKGQKQPISIITMKNAKSKPSPNQYNMAIFDESTRNKQKGKTIAHGRQSYEKIYTPVRKDTYSPHFTIDYPSSIYNVRGQPGKDSAFIKMHEKLKMYTQKMANMKRDVPGPYHVIKDRHLYIMEGLNQRSFGYGNKIDLSKPANDNPGPKYNIQRLCDSYRTVC